LYFFEIVLKRARMNYDLNCLSLPAIDLSFFYGCV
jgi:hypothetical protein